MVKRLQFLLFDQAVFSFTEFEPTIRSIPARFPHALRAQQSERHFDGWRAGPVHGPSRFPPIAYASATLSVAGNKADRAQKSMPVSRHFRPCDRVRGRKGEPAEERRLAAVFRRHAKTVYRLCYTYLGNAANAEDAVQTVFAKLLGKPRRFNDAEHEKAWLIVCAQNHCRDVLKSAARRCAAELPDDDARRPDGRRRRRDARGGARPSPKYKTCVYLYYYEGYRTADIALITGTPDLDGAQPLRARPARRSRPDVAGERRERP